MRSASALIQTTSDGRLMRENSAKSYYYNPPRDFMEPGLWQIFEVPRGENNHHIAEAIFKAFGRALRDAVRITGSDVPSTKGSL